LTFHDFLVQDVGALVTTGPTAATVNNGNPNYMASALVFYGKTSQQSQNLDAVQNLEAEFCWCPKLEILLSSRASFLGSINFKLEDSVGFFGNPPGKSATSKNGFCFCC